MKTLRRGLCCMALVLTTMSACVEAVFAQQAGNNSAPSNVQVVGRSFYVEGIVVVLLIGGALYAVCRSSRRV